MSRRLQLSCKSKETFQATQQVFCIAKGPEATMLKERHMEHSRFIMCVHLVSSVMR
jgi:hypothetical protein